MTFGSGYIPDPPPSRVQRMGSAVRGARARLRVGGLPRQGGFTDIDPWTYNQRGTQSCTNAALAQCVYWLTGKRSSAVFSYYYARAYEFGPKLVVDVGARPSLVVKAARKHGLPPHGIWHLDSKGFDINAEPPGLVRMQGQKKLIDLRPIYAGGYRLVERIVDSLNRGQPCVLTVDIDPTFDEGVGVIPAPAPDAPSRGLHLVAAQKFRTRPSDMKFEVFVQNSWGGASWGIKGGQWLSPERVGVASWAAYVHSVNDL